MVAQTWRAQPRVDTGTQSGKYAFMRTTLDLPNDLFRQAKARAALDGISFKKLITGYIRQGLSWASRQSAESTRAERSQLPIIRAATGRPLATASNADLYRILEDEEVDLDLLHLKP